MKIISKITGTVTDSPTPQVVPKHAPRHVQSQKGYWRHLTWTKDFLMAENSIGSQVKIPISEIWATVEVADPTMAIPKLVDAPTKAP